MISYKSICNFLKDTTRLIRAMCHFIVEAIYQLMQLISDILKRMKNER